jgi:hypothetical protein
VRVVKKDTRLDSFWLRESEFDKVASRQFTMHNKQKRIRQRQNYELQRLLDSQNGRVRARAIVRSRVPGPYFKTDIRSLHDSWRQVECGASKLSSTSKCSAASRQFRSKQL